VPLLGSELPPDHDIIKIPVVFLRTNSVFPVGFAQKQQRRLNQKALCNYKTDRKQVSTEKQQERPREIGIDPPW
jgi:hypothetical protein